MRWVRDVRRREAGRVIHLPGWVRWTQQGGWGRRTHWVQEMEAAGRRGLEEQRRGWWQKMQSQKRRVDFWERARDVREGGCWVALRDIG